MRVSKQIQRHAMALRKSIEAAPIMVMLVLLAVAGQTEAEAKKYVVPWSTEGIASFPNGQLDVKIGDNITFQCVNDSYSNLVYLKTVQQYDSCNKSNVTENLYTGVNHTALELCLGNGMQSLLQSIRESSSTNAGSAVPYAPGRMYYFVSFASVGCKNAQCTLQFINSGGECAAATPLKLAIRVLDNISTEPTTVIAATNSTEQPTTQLPSIASEDIIPNLGNTAGVFSGALPQSHQSLLRLISMALCISLLLLLRY